MFTEPILALETSAGASACLLFPDGQCHTASMATPRAHSRELLPMLQELLLSKGLGWSDIGAFAVATGPGSFTGLRVACATMAGINASLKKPVYRLDSLEIVARQSDELEPLWAIEDARSGLVYAAQYQQGKNLEAARCINWEEFRLLEPKRYISSGEVPEDLPGWEQLEVKRGREQALEAVVRALQPEDEHDFWLEPVYLQVSQAEKNFL